MSTNTAFKAMADFRDGIKVSLTEALHASYHVVGGRSGLEVCKYAVVMMAQSARKMAIKAKPKRKIQRGANGRDYVEVLYQSPKPMLTVWFPREPGDSAIFQVGEGPNAKDHYRRGVSRQTLEDMYVPVRNVGMAGESWFWGGAGRASIADKRGDTVESSPLPIGVGWQLTNKLSYINAAMPLGWATEVESRAAGRMMHEAARKLFPDWVRTVQDQKKAQAAARRSARALMRLKEAA